MSKLSLNDHLFESLEWLSDRSVKGKELDEEIKRGDAKCKIAQQIIANNNSIVNAFKAVDSSIGKGKLPKYLLGE